MLTLNLAILRAMTMRFILESIETDEFDVAQAVSLDSFLSYLVKDLLFVVRQREK